MKTLYVKNRKSWRKWLEKNHSQHNEVWLIYYKKHTQKPSIPYNDSIEEALCFGWIDSIIKRIDGETYARKFTPRTNTVKWSEENKVRIRKLIRQGRMTKIGLSKINATILKKKQLSPMQKLQKNFAIPDYLKQALMKDSKVWDNFNKLAPSYQRAYIGWIDSAKKDDTRQRRIKEAVSLLTRNQKLGMK